MPSKEPKNNDPLLNFFNGIEEFVSSNAEEAVNYLKEEDIDYKNLVEENVDYIKNLQAQYMLKAGEEKQNWFERKKQEFLKTFEANREKIHMDLAALQVQVNFKNLSTEGLSNDELETLFEDAKFLDYLEQEFPDQKDDEGNS